MNDLSRIARKSHNSSCNPKTTAVVLPSHSLLAVLIMSEFRLGDLQLRIMQVLWSRGPATVAEVHEALNDRGLAYTTIATMLRKMEDRGLVAHRSSGRKFIYHAAVSAQDVTRSMAGDILDRLFEGSLADMVHHMLTERDVTPEELRRLEALIANRKKTSRGSHAR